MISGVNYIGVRVADLERSIEFYRDLLGFEVVADRKFGDDGLAKVTNTPGVQVQIVRMRRDALGEIELIHVESPDVAPFDRSRNVFDVGGAFIISLNVDDIYGLYRDLSARGARFRSEPTEVVASDSAGAVIVFMEDPDGTVIEFVQGGERE